VQRTRFDVMTAVFWYICDNTRRQWRGRRRRV